MGQGFGRKALLGIFVTAVMALPAPSAWASISPTLTLDQSAGTAAGSIANLGVHLQFAPTGTDSPDVMTLNLPAGLVANASVNGGACLTTTDLTDSACQVGTGTVTAKAFGTVPIPTSVTFDLVPPPAPGDLAGLAVNSSGTQVGATADIRVRPSGDPLGVGVTINFVLPNNLYGVPISITDINSTFDGLRYPTTCPSTPQNFSVSANSYSDTAVHTVAAPLSVTRCSALPFAPAFSVTAVKDSADDKVTLSSRITQSATEAPSQSVSLGFPFPTLAPNIQAVGVLCPNLSSGHCTPVGSVTATSPLYPKTLTGRAYLTGTLTGLSLTMVFPSPFPLTLVGSVNLSTNTTVFNGLPDIPLTDLDVSLTSGPHALFHTTCTPPSGTATAVLTDQNGDKTVTAPGKFTVTGCPTSSGGGSTGGGGTTGVTVGSTSISKGRLIGIGAGHPSLSFRVAVAKQAAKLRALTIELPSGLKFVRHRSAHKLTGITVSGAKIKSLSLSHRHLLITLVRPVASLTVKIKSSALTESAKLLAEAKAGRLRSLVLTVITESTNSKRTTIRVRIRKLGL